MKSRLIVIVTSVLMLSISADAWILAIKGGKIFTMSGTIIENGNIVIENNKITSVGKDIAIPREAEIIDATGKVITPGLFDAYSNIGLIEIGAVAQTVDIEENSSPLTPNIRVIDAINTRTEVIPVTRIEGVTTALVAPGTGNVISGQSAVLDLYGSTVDQMLVKAPAALHINFGERAVGKWRDKKKIDTRMGLVAMLRQAFIDAQDYKNAFADYDRKLQEYKSGNAPQSKGKKPEEPKMPARDLGKEILVMAMEQKLPVIAAAQRRDDILTAINIADEFNLKMILLFGSEAYMVAETLAKKNIPVLVGPITTQPSSMETLGAIYENAALLDKAGVKIAIITGGAHGVRDLRFQAGIAVEYGLPFEAALKAVTIYPAQILGVDKDLGSIEAGRIANIAIFDGDPLQPLTMVTEVIIEGRRMPMSSIQTELYEKFK